MAQRDSARNYQGWRVARRAAVSIICRSSRQNAAGAAGCAGGTPHRLCWRRSGSRPHASRGRLPRPYDDQFAEVGQQERESVGRLLRDYAVAEGL